MTEYHNSEITKHLEEPKHNPDLFKAVQDVIVPSVIPAIAVAARWMDSVFPAAPSGLVPWSNRRLFLKARAAYYGGWGEAVAFLEYVGAKPSEENILVVKTVLAPTFAPQNPHKRTAWERQNTRKANEFHRRRLRDTQEAERKRFLETAKHEIVTDPEEIAQTPIHRQERSSYPGSFWEIDLRTLRVRNDIYATLNPAHAEVVWMLTKYLDPNHAHTNVKFVAERLGLSPATVRWYRSEAKNHPDLRRNTGL